MKEIVSSSIDQLGGKTVLRNDSHNRLNSEAIISALFRHIALCEVVTRHRRFGATYRSLLQGLRSHFHFV